MWVAHIRAPEVQSWGDVMRAKDCTCDMGNSVYTSTNIVYSGLKTES